MSFYQILVLQTLNGIEAMFKNCTEHLPERLIQVIPDADRERYYEHEMVP